MVTPVEQTASVNDAASSTPLLSGCPYELFRPDVKVVSDGFLLSREETLMVWNFMGGDLGMRRGDGIRLSARLIIKAHQLQRRDPDQARRNFVNKYINESCEVFAEAFASEEVNTIRELNYLQYQPASKRPTYFTMVA